MVHGSYLTPGVGGVEERALGETGGNETTTPWPYCSHTTMGKKVGGQKRKWQLGSNRPNWTFLTQLDVGMVLLDGRMLIEKLYLSEEACWVKRFCSIEWTSHWRGAPISVLSLAAWWPVSAWWQRLNSQVQVHQRPVTTCSVWTGHQWLQHPKENAPSLHPLEHKTFQYRPFMFWVTMYTDMTVA